MRQQLSQVALLERGQALEHVFQVSPRIVPIELGRLDQASAARPKSSPACCEPTNSPLRRPKTSGRTEFSSALLSMGTWPSSRKRVSAAQLLSE